MVTEPSHQQNPVGQGLAARPPFPTGRQRGWELASKGGQQACPPGPRGTWQLPSHRDGETAVSVTPRQGSGCSPAAPGCRVRGIHIMKAVVSKMTLTVIMTLIRARRVSEGLFTSGPEQLVK